MIMSIEPALFTKHFSIFVGELKALFLSIQQEFYRACFYVYANEVHNTLHQTAAAYR